MSNSFTTATREDAKKFFKKFTMRANIRVRKGYYQGPYLQLTCNGSSITPGLDRKQVLALINELEAKLSHFDKKPR